MDRIWAPWRIEYILGVKPEEDARRETSEECLFCSVHRSGEDMKNLVVYRGEENFIMMNLYPYNSGHLMIAPNRHLNTLEQMTDTEIIECMALARKMLKVFREVMNPEGFNLGWNLGRVAGAGITEHAHLHIVPRWNGDSNFMPVLGDTTVISEHIEQTFKKLRDAAQESF